MKTKHSPGPFRAGGEGEYLGVNAVFDAKGIIVADASDRSSHANSTQRAANARLFAAAPELLELVERAADTLENILLHHSARMSKADQFGRDAFLKELRAGLRKAV